MRAAHYLTPDWRSRGLTASSFLASGTLGQAFNYALGGGIYYQLNTGSLPPGLLLNTATGQISGTPTQAGSYSFDYTLTPPAARNRS